ncbi:MAG: ATP synthase F1 subunit epsilon [Bacteroidetes bacterium]|nr:ATP synthase F1 subunit epsilon [Bacteroidota bacterium]
MAGTLYVEIVSPGGAVFRGEAVSVTAPGVEGSFQVLPGHSALIAACEIGLISLTLPDGKDLVFATSGGFVEVVDDHVTVLAETAEPGSAIDIERAKEAETRAAEQLRNASSEEREEAMKALQRARNRLRVSMGSVGREL